MATPESVLDISSDRSPAATDRTVMHLWQTIGAAKVVNQIVATLGSQSLHAIERVRDEKLYLAAGYENFREFLDKHPESPMTYDQFNRRVKLLDTEGEIVFDLLNSLNVPQSARKLLAGEIEIDGNEIRVGDARVHKDDGASLLNLITTQHAKLLEQQRSNERLSKKLKKGEEDFEKLKRKVVTANPTGTPTGQALLTAAGALAQLCEALESAPDEERHALKDQIFDLMRAKQLDLSVALGDISKEEAKTAGATDEALSDTELDDLES